MSKCPRCNKVGGFYKVSQGERCRFCGTTLTSDGEVIKKRRKEYLQQEANFFNTKINSILQRKDLKPSVRKVLKEFDDDNTMRELTLATRRDYLTMIALFFKVVNKAPKSISRKDIEKYILSINHKKPATKKHQKAQIKRFFQWFYGKDSNDRSGWQNGFPQIVSWIELRMSRTTRELPKEIITQQEIKRMITNAENFRDKALIFVLYESGCRRNELLGCKLKDVKFDKHGARIKVSGKTGQRRIRLLKSVPALQDWINHHPYPDDEDNALFVALRSYSPVALGKDGLNNIVKKLSKKCGIKKNIYPHLFRHTRMTELAKFMTDREMIVFAGWSRTSKMPSVYTHLTEDDVDNKLLEKAGKRKAEESKDLLLPIKCPRCKLENAVGSRYCNCGMPLDDKTLMKVEEEQELIKSEMSNYQSNVIESFKMELLKEIRKELNKKK